MTESKKGRKRRKGRESCLLEVLATNQYQGRHILLETYHDADRLGLTPACIRTMKSLPVSLLKGFRITAVPLTNGEIPGQQEVIDHFKAYPKCFNLRHKPVVGEIVQGPFQGEKMAFFSSQETDAVFPDAAIRRACHSQTPYAGLLWRRAETFAEAETIHCRPEQDMLASVFRRRYSYGDKLGALIKAEDFTYQLKEVVDRMQNWYHKTDFNFPHTRDSLNALLICCYQLDKAIKTYHHYHLLRDTLIMFQDILIRGNSITPSVFMGHCKMIERIANEH